MAAPALARPPFVQAERLRRLVSARSLIVGLVVLVVAYLALVPIGFLLWQTFVRGGHLTLASFREAYSETGLVGMTLNSFAFAGGSTALAVVLGTTLAHLVVRTDVPFKPLMFAAGSCTRSPGSSCSAPRSA